MLNYESIANFKQATNLRIAFNDLAVVSTRVVHKISKNFKTQISFKSVRDIFDLRTFMGQSFVFL